MSVFHEMIPSHWATETIQMKVALNLSLGTGFEPCHIFMLEAFCCTLVKDGVSIHFACLLWMSKQTLRLGWQVAKGICHLPMNFCDLLEWFSLPGYQGWPILAWSYQHMWLSLEHRLGLLSRGHQFLPYPCGFPLAFRAKELISCLV